MKSILFTAFFKLVRALLRILPTSLTVRLFRYSRNVFSIRLNGILEEQLYTPLLKGNPTVLDLPRVIIPIPVERKMIIRVGDYSQRIYWCGHFDEVASYLLLHLREADSFIDIGANCGFLTLVASSRIPGAHIYCFEPNPDVYCDLTNNLRLNNIDANTFNLALSNKKERCRLFVEDGAFGGGSMLTNWQRRELLPGEKLPTTFHEVEADLFDNLWKGISSQAPAGPGKIIIKLDAEGFELNIVSGMSAFLTAEASRITLLIEVYESEYDEAVKALSAHGFVCFSILSDGTTTAPARPSKNRFSNYCFKKAQQEKSE